MFLHNSSVFALPIPYSTMPGNKHCSVYLCGYDVIPDEDERAMLARVDFQQRFIKKQPLAPPHPTFLGLISAVVRYSTQAVATHSPDPDPLRLHASVSLDNGNARSSC